MIERVRDGRFSFSDDSRRNHERLQQRIRDGTFVFGELVGCRASALTFAGAPPVVGDNDYTCLLDGHHRVITLAMLGKLPETVRMFVGSRPAPMGIAVLNGVH